MNADMNGAVRLRRLHVLVIVTTALGLSCGSSPDQSPTSPTSSSPGATGIILRNWRVTTGGRFAGMGLNYSFSGEIVPVPQNTDDARLVSMEGTVFGADGQPYFTWTDTITQPEIGFGKGGGFGSMSDPVVSRPPASTFVVKVGYVAGRRTGVVEISGPVGVVP